MSTVLIMSSGWVNYALYTILCMVGSFVQALSTTWAGYNIASRNGVVSLCRCHFPTLPAILSSLTITRDKHSPLCPLHYLRLQTWFPVQTVALGNRLYTTISVNRCFQLIMHPSFMHAYSIVSQARRNVGKLYLFPDCLVRKTTHSTTMFFNYAWLFCTNLAIGWLLVTAVTCAVLTISSKAWCTVALVAAINVDADCVLWANAVPNLTLIYICRHWSTNTNAPSGIV